MCFYPCPTFSGHSSHSSWVILENMSAHVASLIKTPQWLLISLYKGQVLNGLTRPWPIWWLAPCKWYACAVYWLSECRHGPLVSWLGEGTPLRPSHHFCVPSCSQHSYVAVELQTGREYSASTVRFPGSDPGSAMCSVTSGRWLHHFVPHLSRR